MKRTTCANATCGDDWDGIGWLGFCPSCRVAARRGAALATAVAFLATIAYHVCQLFL